MEFIPASISAKLPAQAVAIEEEPVNISEADNFFEEVNSFESEFKHLHKKK